MVHLFIESACYNSILDSGSYRFDVGSPIRVARRAG